MATTAPIKVPILGIDMYSKEFGKMMSNASKMGAKMSSIGRSMTTMVTAPILGAAAASAKFSMDFNESMANVGTLIPGQAAKLQKLKGTVQDLAVETGVSTKSISEGLYETVSAFGDSAENAGQLAAATKMSVAGLATVKESLSLVSAVTKGYGDISTEAVKKVSDLAFQTVKMGQTTFPELAASMGKVVPVAAALNISQEELFGSFATLTGVTGNASEVSTQMSAVLTAMLKPTDTLTKTVKKLGFESSTAMLKEKGLVDTFELLQETVGTNTSKLTKMLGRKEAVVAALALMGEQAEEFDKKTTAMGDSLGKTDEAFDEQTKGINKTGHAYKVAKQTIVVSMQKIGDVVMPHLAEIAKHTAAAAKWFSELDSETMKFGIKALGLTAAIGPFVNILGKMVSGVPIFAWFHKMNVQLLRTAASQRKLNDLSTGVYGPLQKGSAHLDKAGRRLKQGGKAIAAAAPLLLEAALAGAAMGTLLSKFVEDQADKQHKDIVELEGLSAGSKAKKLSDTMSKEDKLKALSKSEKALGAVKHSFSVTDIIDTLEMGVTQAPTRKMSAIMHGISEVKKAEAALDAERKQVSDLATWIEDPTAITANVLRAIQMDKETGKSELDIHVFDDRITAVSKDKKVNGGNNGPIMDGKL